MTGIVIGRHTQVFYFFWLWNKQSFNYMLNIPLVFSLHFLYIKHTLFSGLNPKPFRLTYVPVCNICRFYELNYNRIMVTRGHHCVTLVVRPGSSWKLSSWTLSDGDGHIKKSYTTPHTGIGHRQAHIKSPRIHPRIQLAVGDMTMSGC